MQILYKTLPLNIKSVDNFAITKSIYKDKNNNKLKNNLKTNLKTNLLLFLSLYIGRIVKVLLFHYN